MKTIIFIPPNGILKKHDFSLQRIANVLETDSTMKSVLIYIDNQQDNNIGHFDEIYKVNSKQELIEKIKEINYDIIFSRGWMHAYPFCAELVKKFDNVIVNIKDWNFATKEEYKFLFGNDDDFDAIEYIFKNAKHILPHYTTQQAKLWLKEYQLEKDKFVFFPEYCNIVKNDISIKKFTNSIVFAGAFSSSTYPKRFFVSKDMLKAIDVITKQKIKLTYVLPPQFYDSLDERLFKDYFYEDKFNKYFDLQRGKELDSSVLRKHKYAIFSPIINKKRNNKLFKYAVPSKFAFYLEANIPMIVNKKMKSLSSLVKNNNLGVVVSNKDMKNISKILESFNYEELVDNIRKYKRTFTYDNSNLKEILCN
ncbi:hypothetical protein [Poseidonibacter sp.]|uniref:hypothetical protein n=1 Tax=Poseidonibacter sp. TaxID=2321188 RepID=UPI003C75CC38